jgi:hypothetical protein
MLDPWKNMEKHGKTWKLVEYCGSQRIPDVVLDLLDLFKAIHSIHSTSHGL